LGQEFLGFDQTESLKLAERYDCEIGKCFDNCRRIAKESKLQYVQGFADAADGVEEHAWLINSAGEVLDPTYCLIDGVEPSKISYFGLTIPLKFLDANKMRRNPTG